ncbi:MAG: aminotransferase class I/II-fold pyridoxal phosphate-dependent enzyme [Vallitaleaceae bacterium]|nr:aminotransferase class I/II-fold pyridoxal phosphate-dependent enzyme [Vallitaleaceae bacterium]
MTKPQVHFHGSDLEKIAAAYDIPKEAIINFSSNVNPLGLSAHILEFLPKKIELIASYPDRDYTNLRKTIGEYVHCNPETIMVGNGSTELISLGIKAIAPKKAVIIGPTYSEYEREITLLGGSSTYYSLKETLDFKLDHENLLEVLTQEIDLLVICNPNNPTSTAIRHSVMKELLTACEALQIFVMIDETYVEFSEDIEDVTAIPLTESFEQLMVIRGVSKFFAAPGLRLGYAICKCKKHFDRINTLKNPWTINALAAYAGELLLKDDAYILKTKAFMAAERRKIVDTLSSWKCVKFYEPVANFVLVKLLTESITSRDLFEKLLQKQLMIRDASSFDALDSHYFRFCFLKSEENELLLKALEEILQS